MVKYKDGLVRIRLNDSKMADLPCKIDQQGKIIEVYDYQGNKLIHNAPGRSVIFNDRVWFY